MSQLFEKSINSILTGEDCQAPSSEEVSTTRQPALAEERRESNSSPSAKIDFQAIADLAPFVDAATLAQMLENCDLSCATPDRLVDLAPFLESENLDRLASRFASIRMTHLQALAPFLSSAGLTVLMERTEEDFSLAQLSEIAPFLTSEACSKAFMRLLSDQKHTEFRDFAPLAPFISSEAMQALAETLEPRSCEEIAQVAPFLDEAIVSRIAQRLAAKR